MLLSIAVVYHIRGEDVNGLSPQALADLFWPVLPYLTYNLLEFPQASCFGREHPCASGEHHGTTDNSSHWIKAVGRCWQGLFTTHIGLSFIHGRTKGPRCERWLESSFSSGFCTGYQ